MRVVSAFSLAFFSGLAIFIAVGLIPLDLSHQLWSTAIVVIFGVYVGVSHRRESGAIDAIYYLGFIFTLMALCFSLLPAAIGGSEGLSKSGDLASTVLSSFAVAFTTTLVGLVLRVFLFQINNIDEEDTVDVESATRDVARALEANALELRSASTTFKEAKDEIAEELKGAISTITNAGQQYLQTFEKQSADLNTAMLSNADRYNAALENSQSIFEDAMKLTASNMENSLSSSLTLLTETQETTKNLGSSIEHLLLSVTADVKAAVETISAASVEASESMAATSLSNLKPMQKVVDNIESSVKQSLLSMADDARSAVEIISTAAADASKSMAATSASNLEPMQKVVANIESSVKQSLLSMAEDARSAVDIISTASVDASKSMVATSASNVESINAVAPTLDSIIIALGETVKVIDSFNSSMQTTASEINTKALTTLAASTEISEFNTQLSAMNKSVASVTELGQSMVHLEAKLTQALEQALEVNEKLHQAVISTAEKVSNELEKQIGRKR